MGELEKIIESLIPIFLYTEIHSKFSPIPNILNNKLPEIIADAPQRIDRNKKLPVLILVKDSHLYPLELLSIRLSIKQEGKIIREVELLDETLSLAQRLWYRLFDIDPGTEGRVKIDILFTVKQRNKILKLRNSSYRSVKKKEFKCLRLFRSITGQFPNSVWRCPLPLLLYGRCRGIWGSDRCDRKNCQGNGSILLCRHRPFL